jgi:hypothetical protein
LPKRPGACNMACKPPITWHQQEPVPGLAPEYFSVRWTGYLFAPVTGDYKFYLTLDDGMRLWVGNKLLFNEWGDHREYTTWVPMHLKAGTFYPLRLEYRQGPLWNRALLAWVRPDMKPAPPSTSNYLGLQKVYTRAYSGAALILRCATAQTSGTCFARRAASGAANCTQSCASPETAIRQ